VLLLLSLFVARLAAVGRSGPITLCYRAPSFSEAWKPSLQRFIGRAAQSLGAPGRPLGQSNAYGPIDIHPSAFSARHMLTDGISHRSLMFDDHHVDTGTDSCLRVALSDSRMVLWESSLLCPCKVGLRCYDTELHTPQPHVDEPMIQELPRCDCCLRPDISKRQRRYVQAKFVFTQCDGLSVVSKQSRRLMWLMPSFR